MKLPKGTLPAASLCAVLLLPVLFLAHMRFYSSRSRLPEQGVHRVVVNDLKEPVEVGIDARGIPYVTARNQQDLWFAQGYVHARDRFFQMEMMRRMAKGTLAEVFGDSKVRDDRRARILRLESTARRQLLDLEDPERKALAAYCAGVNAALLRFESWIAPEIWLLGIEPTLWKPNDTLSIVLLVQSLLSRSMTQELERSTELGQLGRDRVEQLWGWSRQQSRSWIPPVESPDGTTDIVQLLAPRTAGPTLHWAVAGSRAADGRPLLASAPAFAPTLPGIWSAVGLTSPDLRAVGVSIAGVPGLIIGHNERVAWSYGPSFADDQDVFVVTLDESRSRELTDGQWTPIRTIAEEIEIRWNDRPELLKVRMSRHGPVLRESPSGALALSWTAHNGPSPMQAFLRAMRAESTEDVASAWTDMHGPPLSLVAADVDGNILHQFVGKVPNRRSGAGRLPAPGDRTRWDWEGIQPLSEAVAISNPESGFVAACGHDPFAEGEVGQQRAVAGEFEPPWRIRRLRRKLESRSDWTIADCLELQRDIRSDLAVALLKALWPDFKRHQGPTAQALLGWDGEMSEDRPEPHLFLELMIELQRETGLDEAAENGLERSPFDMDRLLSLLVGGIDEDWWDNIATREVETRAEIVDQCLDRLDNLADPSTWGQRHQVHISHPMSQVPFIGALLGTSGHVARHALAGGRDTLDEATWNPRAPYDVTTMPTMRFVADVGHWDRCVIDFPVALSGRPWSTNFGDRIPLWKSKTPVELPFSDAAVERAVRARLLMAPPD